MFQDPSPLPVEVLCICLDVQARRRTVDTELGLERLQSLVRVSKKCCLDHFLQTQQVRGSAHSSWGLKSPVVLEGAPEDHRLRTTSNISKSIGRQSYKTH